MNTRVKLATFILIPIFLLILLVYIPVLTDRDSLSVPAGRYTLALAQDNEPPAPGPLILTDKQDSYPLGLHMDILEDPGGALSIEEVSSPEYDLQFVPSSEKVPNYGFTDSIYWVRLDLANEAHQEVKWLLEVGFSNMQFVDLYTPLPDGQGFAVKQTGTLRPVSTRDVLYPKIIFELVLPTQSEQTYYLRFQNEASMTLSMNLWTQDAFFNEAQQKLLLNGLFFGAIIALLVYHIFLLITLRETSYLLFVIILASLLVEELTFNGYLETYIFPDLYPLKPYYYPLSFSILLVSIVLFSDTFLEVKTHFQKFHWLNVTFIAGWGVLILLIPFISYHYLANMMVPWALLSLFAVLATGIASWRSGFRPALLLMIAWLGMILSLITIMLVRLDITPSTLFSENIYKFGLIWMAVCWSIALADRINLLKSETERANRALSNSKRQLSQVLEGLPLGVALYGKDHKPRYINKRTTEILSNREKGIQTDLSAGRTLAQAIDYFSLRAAGSNQVPPIESFPVFSALQGVPASTDEIEIERGDERIPLEIWASPIRNDAGNVEAAVMAFQDITYRKQAEAELDEYRLKLESLVQNRTAELDHANKELQLRIEWLSAVVHVNQIMARFSDVTQIYEDVIGIINRLFAMQDSFIAELDKGRQQIKILAHSCRSHLHPDLTNSTAALPESIPSNPDPEAGMLHFVSNDQLDSFGGILGMHIQVTKIQSIALVPLQLREKVFGFLGLEMIEEERVITDEEAKLLNIFTLDIAQLIENNYLFEQAKALITKNERSLMARDLHDSVTQVLFSASMIAEILPQIWRRDPELGLERLEKLRRLIRGALAEMRTILLELRPSAVANIPLSDLLGQLTEAVTSRSGLPFQLFIEQIPILPEDVQITFFRVAQEALNNVIKHAQANRVSVSLSATQMNPDPSGESGIEVKLTIQDDGVGYYAGKMQADRMGIRIMHERAAAIQADFSLDSRPGYGTDMTLIWSSKTEDPS